MPLNFSDVAMSHIQTLNLGKKNKCYFLFDVSNMPPPMHYRLIPGLLCSEVLKSNYYNYFN